MSERIRFGIQLPPGRHSSWTHEAAASLVGQPVLDKEGKTRGEFIEAHFNERTGLLEASMMVDPDFVPPGLHPQDDIARVSAAFSINLGPVGQ